MCLLLVLAGRTTHNGVVGVNLLLSTRVGSACTSGFQHCLNKMSPQPLRVVVLHYEATSSILILPISRGAIVLIIISIMRVFYYPLF